MKKKWLAHEALAFFTATMAVLWLVPGKAFAVLFVFLSAAMIFSWWYQKDSLHDIGLLPNSFRGWKVILVSVCAIVVVLNLLGNVWSVSSITLDFGKFRSDGPEYLVWAFIQQLVLNGYFANRIFKVTNDKISASAFSGSMFALVHLPNPTLFVASLLLGPLAAYIFLISEMYIFLLLLTLLSA